MKHFMLDLETMSSARNAAIVSIGAVEFDPCSQRMGVDFYTKVSLADSMRAGLHVSGSTIDWWMQQSDAARAEIYNTPDDSSNSLRFNLEKFNNYLMDHCGFVVDSDSIAIWGNGATFDNVVIRSAYDACGMKAPWSFRNDKCYRTVIKMLPKDKQPELVRVGTSHNAVADAITQALHLQKCLALLGIKEIG